MMHVRVPPPHYYYPSDNPAAAADIQVMMLPAQQPQHHHHQQRHGAMCESKGSGGGGGDGGGGSGFGQQQQQQQHLQRWAKCEELGRGAHGTVYRAILLDTGESIAVKQIHTSGMRRSELQVRGEEGGARRKGTSWEAEKA